MYGPDRRENDEVKTIAIARVCQSNSNDREGAKRLLPRHREQPVATIVIDLIPPYE